MINNEREMAGCAPEAQAFRAIFHTLSVIAENPAVGWHMGAGTHSFALLTEALATLKGSDLVETRKKFIPKNARDPRSPAPLGKMTQDQAADSITDLVGKLTVLQDMLACSITPAAPMETDIDALAEDCGLSADAIRHLIHIARTL